MLSNVHDGVYGHHWTERGACDPLCLAKVTWCAAAVGRRAGSVLPRRSDIDGDTCVAPNSHVQGELGDGAIDIYNLPEC